MPHGTTIWYEPALALMERLPFEILLVIIEQVLDDPTLDCLARIELMLLLPRINKRLRWIYLYKASMDVYIPSRAFYEYWVSKLESLPRDHILNTRCRSFELRLEYSWREFPWFCEQNLLRGLEPDPVPYFMGNILTQKGLFPNLRTIHIRFGTGVEFDPYNFLFPACLPKSVNALYLHYYIPEYWRDVGYYGEQPTFKRIFRSTPIRFSSRKHPLEVLDILVTGDEVRDEIGIHYTDAPIFRDIARLWGSLFDATPRLFIQGIPRPIENASKNIISLDMNEALECYSKRQRLEGIGWKWWWYPLVGQSGSHSQSRSSPEKKKEVRRLIQKFSALKSFLKWVRGKLCKN